MMLTLTSICEPSSDVVYQLADGEAVLVLPQAGQIKVLNEVGTFIWTLLDGNRSIAEIANRICQEYRVESEQSQADTLQFMADLESRGIVQVMAR